MGFDATELKKIVGERSAELPENGMVIGLGSGSTAERMVVALADRIRRGDVSDLRFVATSERTREIAEKEGLNVEELDQFRSLDMTIDGADEIDPRLRLIKGLGGALLREKIVAQASSRMVVIADFSKRVETLGQGVLPVEVIRFGLETLRRRLDEQGYRTTLRGEGDDPFITDEGNYILDLDCPENVAVPEIDTLLQSMAGVVETGFFGSEATEAVIAEENGVVTYVRGRDVDASD